MKIIKLLEDYYQLLDPKTQKEIDSSNLRDKVSNNIVDSNIVKKLNTIEDIQAILTDTDLNIDPKIKRELLELFLAKNSIPLSGDEETIIVAKLLKEDPVKIFSGNSPWFELINNLKKYKLDYDVIEAIENLNKSNDITNQDMKNKNSWLYDENIWEEEKPQNQIYKIKLKIFLDDKDNLKKFANTDGVPITEIDDDSIKKLLKWETAIEIPANILRQQYSQFTSDKYDDEQEAKNREEKGKVTFEEYLEQLFKDTEKSKNPWKKDNYIDQINKIINSNITLNEVDKKDLINNLKILIQDKLLGKLLRHKIESNLDIINKENHKNLFIKWLQGFFKNSADLAASAEKQVPIKKLKATPGKQYTFKEALKFLNLGEGNSPKELALKLSRIKSERENLTNYTSQLQKILNNEKARKLLFEAPIVANKNGGFNIVNFLKKYIEGAVIPKT